ncbi:MAG: TonB family protein [Syntrophobacteraceae bacterium]
MAKKPTQNKLPILIAAGVAVAFVVAVVVVVKVFLTGDFEKRKPQATAVTLMKPPPPPPKEKPPEPEPEIKKERKVREEILDSGPDKPSDSKEPPRDDKPAGKHLGVDAEGGAGSDGFGLVGNKGGAGLIGGGGSGGGGSGLMSKYGWYANIVQEDIRNKVQKLLEADGGLPKEKSHVIVKVKVNDRGMITDFRITTPSGNVRLDGALKRALENLTLRQPPPQGMPKTMNIKVATQG